MTDVPGGQPPRDPTLQHPHCVFQILKRHFARYTPEAVSQVCGCTPEQLVQVAELLCANSGRERTSRHRLRPGLDAAHHWRTDDPHRRHPAAVARQHGPARRRHHGHARPLHHPGLDRRRHPVRRVARLPAAAGRRQAARDARLLRRARGPAHRLLGPTSASSSSACSRPGTATPPRRRTTSASRGCREWTPTTRSWPTSTAWRRAKSRAISCSARTPAAAGPTPACTGPACATSTGWWSPTGSRSRAPSSGRATRTARRPPRSRPKSSSSRRRPRRRRRAASPTPSGMLQWHDKAVDPLGDSRSDAWFLYNLGKRLKGLYAGSTDPRDQPLLRLTWDYDFDEAAAPARRHAQPHRGRAGPGKGPAGDQRLRAGGNRLAHGPAPSAERLLRAEGRRLDGVRLLDLQRRLPRTGPQPRPRTPAHRQPSPARMGLRLAGQPPGPVQPRPRRSRRPAVVGAEEAGLVGRGVAPLGGPRPAGFRAGEAARLPAAAGRDRHGGHRGRPAVHPEARRRRLAVRPRRQGRAVAHALRAGRVAAGQPALPQTGVQPDRAPVRGAAQPHRPHADGGVPGGGHHVPADGALPERADESL